MVLCRRVTTDLELRTHADPKPMTEHGPRPRFPAIVGTSLCASSLVGLAIWSWRRWADVQVDFGRELYVPWRLASGDVLYRDLSYFNGPLSPYLNSLGFRLFGEGYSVLAGMNLVVLAAACVMLYLLLREAGDPLSAFAGTLSLIWISAFQHLTFFGNYNWIAPYSHEITHGIALALAALLTAARARREPSPWKYVVTGLALGLVFLTKAEVFLAAAVSVALMLAWPSKSEARASGRSLTLLAGAAALPALLSWLLLAVPLGGGGALVGVLGSWSGIFSSAVPELAFYTNGMGFDEPGANLIELIRWAAKLAIVLGSLAALDRLLRNRVVNRIAAILAAIAIALVLARADLDWGQAARPLPLIVLSGGAWSALELRRARGNELVHALLVRTSLCGFAFVLLLKMLLAARLHHYGFALAMPALAVSFAMVTGWIPEALRRWTRAGVVLRFGAVGLLVGTSIAYLQLSNIRYSNKEHPLGSGADRMLADPVRGLGFELALQEIEQRFPEDATLVVLPEGVTLNYLARRRNPTPYVNFMPPELLLFGEDEIIAALEADPPDGIVLMHKDASEYGAPLFGTHYGRKIARWVATRYEQVRRRQVCLDRIRRSPYWFARTARNLRTDARHDRKKGIAMAVSYSLIVVYPNRLDFKPPCAQVLGGVDPLQIGVDWENNDGAWKKVTVQSFQDAAGTNVTVLPPQESWNASDGRTLYKKFDFFSPAVDFFCKYEVVLEDYAGKTFTVDPVVLIKKPGFAEAG